MKILVPTAGEAAARETAEYILEIALAIGADVLVLHVIRPGKSPEVGERSIKVFREAGEQAGVDVEGSVTEGSIPSEIADFAERHDVTLIVMGASNGAVIDQWTSSDVSELTTIPVLVIPYQVIGA